MKNSRWTLWGSAAMAGLLLAPWLTVHTHGGPEAAPSWHSRSLTTENVTGRNGVNAGLGVTVPHLPGR